MGEIAKTGKNTVPARQARSIVRGVPALMERKDALRSASVEAVPIHMANMKVTAGNDKLGRERRPR